MQYMGPYLVGAAFWIFIGAAAVAGIVTVFRIWPSRRGDIVGG